MILDIIYPEGQVLFAVTDMGDEQAVIDARQYIDDNGLTFEDAKIVRRKNEIGSPSVLVIAKKEVRLRK